MKLGIMQPYLFPYIGYFQLINAVDKFVVYDDVNFIKGGWINRNNLLINKKSNLFTVPLSKPSPFVLISETKINLALYDGWKQKFLQSLNQSYKKAPFFNEVNVLINNILCNKVDYISLLAVDAIVNICEYLKIQTEIVTTSQAYNNNTLKSQDRVLDICKIEKASNYINVSGGINLYSKDIFKKNGIKLNFIKSNLIIYKQFDSDFIPWLSIIDVLMFNSVADIRHMLDNYKLL